MRDPHVEALYFKVSSGDDISYDNPEPLTFSHHLGEFSLEDSLLKVVTAEHFSNGQEASQAVAGFLRSWEIQTDLNRNFEMIRFSYSHADLVDLDPPPPGVPQVIYAEGTASLSIRASASAQLVVRRYPPPPEHFSATDSAGHAYRRWVGYRKGREPLQAMAYFILTLLERKAATRAGACELFKVDRAVLNHLGSLCSERGSALTARKARATEFDELTQIEAAWLEQAVKRLILRLGEQSSGYNLEQISLENVERM